MLYIYLRFDGKSLYAGKELWKETLPLKSGSRVYKLQELKSNSWYEVKISYPASVCQMCYLVLTYVSMFLLVLVENLILVMITDTGFVYAATTKERCNGFEA